MSSLFRVSILALAVSSCAQHAGPPVGGTPTNSAIAPFGDDYLPPTPEVAARLAAQQTGLSHWGPSSPAGVSSPVVKKVLIIPVSFPDAAGVGPDDIHDLILGSGNNSVNDLYKDTSYGRLSFTGDAVPTVTIAATSAAGCQVYTWMAQADALVLASGVNPYSYDLKVYSFNGGGCGVRGYGSPGWAMSFYWYDTAVWAHEMGHGLGLQHAATPTYEYGDQTDIMGYGGGYIGFAAPHKIQLGFQSATVPAASGTYTIPPLESDPSTVSAPQILQLPSADGINSYYLSYHQPIGHDSVLGAAYISGLNVHTWDGAAASHTYYVNTLADTTSFSDADGYTVTQTAHDANGVTVSITLPACIRRPPTLTITPTSPIGVTPGDAVQITITITDNDFAGCGPSNYTITLPTTKTQPGGGEQGGGGSTWTPASTTVSIAGGTSGSVTVTAQTPTTATGYEGFSVVATDDQPTPRSAYGYGDFDFTGGTQPIPPDMSIVPDLATSMPPTEGDMGPPADMTGPPGEPPLDAGVVGDAGVIPGQSVHVQSIELSFVGGAS